MKFKVILPLSILISLSIAACNNTNRSNNQQSADMGSINKQKKAETIGGTYTYGSDIEKEPVGKLMVHPLTDTTALFYLDVNRGAPSYNMGLLAGKIVFKDDKWTYNGDCKLKFDFSPGEVQLNTVEGQSNCEFGNGVTADHLYQLKTTTFPEFYINGEGDTVYFKAMKP